jgi:hypothetical protein
VTDEQRALFASFETVPYDVGRRQSLAVEEQARSQALAMRQYEMSAPAVIHHVACEDVVAARRREQPRVDRRTGSWRILSWLC